MLLYEVESLAEQIKAAVAKVGVWAKAIETELTRP